MANGDRGFLPSQHVDSPRALDRVTRSHGGKPILCFFPVDYAAVEPPLDV